MESWGSTGTRRVFMGRSPVLRATRQFDMTGSKKTSWPFGPALERAKGIAIRSSSRTRESRLCQSCMNSLMAKAGSPRRGGEPVQRPVPSAASATAERPSSPHPSMRRLLLRLGADVRLRPDHLAQAVMVPRLETLGAAGHAFVAGGEQLPRILLPGVERLRLLLGGELVVGRDIGRLAIVRLGVVHLVVRF